MTFETMEHPRDSAPMVLVPAGPFLMGLPNNDLLAEDHEKPTRDVYLSAFWIEVYPVTNARFRRFMDDRGYQAPKWWSEEGWQWREKHKIQQPSQWAKSGWDRPDQPAAGVSWYEPDAYARWAGRRLPSDAEWEKAARGTDGRRYPWGNDWPTSQRANFGMKIGHTSPVGLFPEGVSPFGCHDMAGNVNNWTDDWFWPLFASSRNNGLLPTRLDDILGSHRRHAITHKVDRGGGATTMSSTKSSAARVCCPGTRDRGTASAAMDGDGPAPVERPRSAPYGELHVGLQDREVRLRSNAIEMK